MTHDLHRVETAVAGARPASPGADDLAALAMAADAARAAGAPHAVLVLLDSGLDDRGALNFTVPGMVAAAPPEVASQLRMDGDLPVLHGLTVDLVGLGYTAAPQVPLPAKWRRNITGIWAAVVTAAGAHAEVIPEPVQGPAVGTREPVRTIPVPADTPVVPGTGRPIVLDGESPVRFEPDSTVFADPAAAAHALAPIASWLMVSPSRHALLVGTTADAGTMTGQIRLSRSRAARVRAQLIALGASPAQISIKGVGSDFPQFRPDRSPSGALLPGPATLNRSVRITLAAGGE